MKRSSQALTVIVLLLCAQVVYGQITVTEPFVGVRHIHRVEQHPRPLNIDIIEIDLSAPGLGFLVTPPTQQFPNYNIAQTTSSFLNQHNAQIAINGDFYATAPVGWPYLNPIHLAVSNGVEYSPFNGAEPALNISQSNLATVITQATKNTVDLFNAIGGNEYIVFNGQNTANWNELHPRTAAGVTADQKLLLVTVDGRQAGFSGGMTTPEVANLLIGYGAIHAINLDGGGSTTMVMADPSVRVVNSPSGGAERTVANHLGVFAQHNPDYDRNPTLMVLDDFAHGLGRFNRSVTASGSTQGLATTSSRVRITGDGAVGNAAQRLTLHTSNPATPGFRLRHLSGGGNPSENVELDATGYIGFYLKTTTIGLQASIGIDDQANSAANTNIGLERSTLVDIVADGEWHLYEWDLEDDSQWTNFAGGNGLIDGPRITVDSIFISSLINQDAVVYFDGVTHNPDGPIAPLPMLLAGDANRDGRVDGEDFLIWQSSFGMQSGASWDDGDFNGDGRVDGEDFLIWQAHFGTVAGSSAVTPEPASLGLLFLLAAGLAVRRR